MAEVRLGFPSPDSGPGRPILEKAAERHIKDGWQALRRSDPTAARTSAEQAGVSTASQLLELQAAIVSGKQPVDELEGLTRTAPEYAAGWLTLSVAAEGADNEALALQAAERGASLWPDKRWVERTQSLRRRWVDERVEAANNLFASGDPRASLTTLEPALALDPNNRDAILLQARSLIAIDSLDTAEAVLAGLPRDRDVVLLSGSIAESRGDAAAAIRIYSSLPDDPEATLMAITLAEEEESWQTAMELFSSLPDDHPEKASGLRAAKLRWRVSVMPDYVREALSASDMNRSDLAVVLVTLAPVVETLPSKQVPLLSDIVDMPSQREIITAARLGLIDIDRLEHRFQPLRQVTDEEVRSAVTVLGRLLEIPAPPWCDENSAEPCVSFTPPIAGNQVADVIIGMVSEEAR
jgi:tetratricopeptide (TPR) repeat protein